jgi:hypothetical protein
MFASAFPDGRVTVDRVFTAGNVAIAERTSRGARAGDF